MKKLTIATKTAITYQVILFIMFLLVGIVFYSMQMKTAEDNLESQMNNASEQIIGNMQNYLNNYESILNYLVDTDTYVKDTNPTELLRNVYDSYVGTTAIYFGSKEGKLTIYPAVENLPDPRKRPWYTVAGHNNQVNCSEVYVDVNTGNPVVTLSKAVIYQNEFKGVMAIDIDLQAVAQYVSTYKIGETGKAVWLNQKAKSGRELDALSSATLESDVSSDELIRYSKDYVYVKRTTTPADWTVVISMTREEVDRNQRAAVIKLVAMLFGVLLLLFVVNIFLFRILIDRPIKSILRSFEKSSDGTIHVKTVETKSQDEFGKVADSLNGFTQQLTGLLNSAGEVSESVTSSAESLEENIAAYTDSINEIQNTSTALADSTMQQASSIEDGMNNVQELSQALDKNNGFAKEVVGAVNILVEKLEQTTESLSRLQASSEKTNEMFDAASSLLQIVQDNTREIESVNAVITTVAEQTNLLSLNAAIEAAHAGPSGRGFAVVADEVKKLADSVAGSARSIKQMVGNLQHATKDTVDKVAEVQTALADNNRDFDGMSSAFGAMSQSVDSVKNILVEVKKLTGEMMSAKDSVFNALESLSGISEETAASASELSASVEEQSAGVASILQRAEDLKTDAANLTRALGAIKL